MATATKNGIFSKDGFANLVKQIQYGYDHGGGMGAQMGMLGMPFDMNGITINPHTQTSYVTGTTNPAHFAGQSPVTPSDPNNPNNPNGDPNDPNNPNSGKFSWSFPQYSQSWAFTPPAPTPYSYPQPFDPKKYGNPFAGTKK